MEIAGRTDRTKFRNQVLNTLIGAGFLEMVVPDKPRSSKQKYRLIEKGRDLLVKQTEEATASYVYTYREMWDEEEDFKNGG